MRARSASLLLVVSLSLAASAALGALNEATTSSTTSLRATVRAPGSTGELVPVRVAVDITQIDGVSVDTSGAYVRVQKIEMTAKVTFGDDGSVPPCETTKLTVTQVDDVTTRVVSPDCGFDLTWRRSSATPTPDGTGTAAPRATPGDQTVDVEADVSSSQSATVSGSMGGFPVGPGMPQEASASYKCCRGHVTLMK